MVSSLASNDWDRTSDICKAIGIPAITEVERLASYRGE